MMSYVTVEIPDSVVSTEGFTSATDDRQTDEETAHRASDSFHDF